MLIALLPPAGSAAQALSDGSTGGGGLYAPPGGLQQAAAAHEHNSERFSRAAALVADCRARMRDLATQANAARAFRERCGKLMGAGLAASLELQEVRKKE